MAGVCTACVLVQPGPLLVDHLAVGPQVLHDPAGVLTPRLGCQVGPECFTANLSVALPSQAVGQSVVQLCAAVVTLRINIVMLHHLETKMLGKSPWPDISDIESILIFTLTEDLLKC